MRGAAVQGIVVSCPDCGEVDEADVEVVDVSENEFGEDVLAFVCKCGALRKSPRRGR